jgi:hypothetical protein
MLKKGFVAVVLLTVSGPAWAEEDCLAFTDTGQQIACLARENALLRETINTEIAKLRDSIPQFNHKVGLRSNAWNDICLDNATQGAGIIQGFHCQDVPSQNWTLERRD